MKLCKFLKFNKNREFHITENLKLSKSLIFSKIKVKTFKKDVSFY